MFTKDDIDGFSKAVESLKKYRRADLIDETGKNLLDELYTDFLPQDHILNKCLLDNTTFLIGRKGTGKSTLFLKMENELRKKRTYLPCYIDVKTTYESSETQKIDYDYLNEYIHVNMISKYLLERTFIQNILNAIKNELEKEYKSIFDKLLKTKASIVKSKIYSLSEKINNNAHLKEIEIPIIKKSTITNQTTSSTDTTKNINFGSGENSLQVTPEATTFKNKDSIQLKKQNENKQMKSTIDTFSDIFIRVFEVKEIITEIKDILEILGIRHLIIMLDDLSEINDDNSIITFVDTIIAPLNNWSDEFIKFKIALYPNRIHYGNIDPGKIDTINLDFYNLYSEFDRNKMEEYACDFTKRLIEKRIYYFTKQSPDNYFNVSSNFTLHDYYELLFQVSMNVPRIMGYILSYCHQNKIIFDKKITKTDIEIAAQKYFNDKINIYFQSNVYSLASLNEKITNCQLNELINIIVDKLIDIKKRITSGELDGKLLIQKSPYASHFYVDPKVDYYLKTLELNHFISKYNEQSDKDGNQVDIYCINYGLAMKNNILWGKPKGVNFRKYFIERTFNFTPLINNFITNSKRIHCSNDSCGKLFEEVDIPHLKFNNFKCNKCGSDVIIDTLDKIFANKINSINENILLEQQDLNILIELSSSNEEYKYAREIAEELDYSKYIVAFRCKILDTENGLIERIKLKGNDPYKYRITAKAKSTYIDKI